MFIVVGPLGRGPFFWGLRSGFALRRYASGLAARSALRWLCQLGLALRATLPHR